MQNPAINPIRMRMKSADSADSRVDQPSGPREPAQDLINDFSSLSFLSLKFFSNHGKFFFLITLDQLAQKQQIFPKAKGSPPSHEK